MLHLTFAKMEHSFIFGQPVWGEYFARREQFTDELSRHVTAFRSAILTSPKGWGKKSMALHIGDLLAKKDYTIRTTYIELQRTTSIEDFCQSFVQAFSFDLRLFSISPNSLENHLDEILAIPEYISVRDQVKFIIFIGQIEQIAGFENSIKFQNRLRTTWKLQNYCTYFLYGNQVNVTKHLLDKPGQPFKKIGRRFRLPRIHLQELNELIQNRFQQTGKQIGEKEAKSIANAASCIPYYVQLLAWHVWIRTEKRCTIEIIQHAMDHLTRQYDIHYQHLTDTLTKSQIRFLFAHLRGDYKLCSGYSIQEFNLKSSGHISRLKNSLINKEILGSENGYNYLLDPIFRNWLKEYYFGIP